jgi:acetyl-CoA carboxylase biotin carboxylase subunit
MRRALSEFVVEGIATTIPLHRQMMANEEFAAGRVDTTFIERTLLAK